MVEVHKPELMKTRCIKVIYRKEEKVVTCGKVSKEYKFLEVYGVSFRIGLCKEHLEEFEKNKKIDQAKEDKRFEKTDFKCPECGEPVFKHYHVRHDLYPVYRWFWCPSKHDLYCGNCKHATDSHGDICGGFFCLNGSGWEPIEKEE